MIESVRHAILIHTTAAAREAWRALPDAERDACASVYRELERELRDAGELVLAETLRGPCRATARDLVAFYVVDTIRAPVPWSTPRGCRTGASGWTSSTSARSMTATRAAPCPRSGCAWRRRPRRLRRRPG